MYAQEYNQINCKLLTEANKFALLKHEAWFTPM